jgi:hypothetical protein
MIDVNFLIVPSTPNRPGVQLGRGIGLTSIPLLVGIGGVWFFVFVAMLRRRPLLARTEEDPVERAHAHAPSVLEKGGVGGAHGIH